MSDGAVGRDVLGAGVVGSAEAGRPIRLTPGSLLAKSTLSLVTDQVCSRRFGTCVAKNHHIVELVK